jgi:hypothetical protein
MAMPVASRQTGIITIDACGRHKPRRTLSVSKKSTWRPAMNLRRYSVLGWKLRLSWLTASCIAAVPLSTAGLASPSPLTIAVTRSVTNCNNSGPGSLRDVIAQAGSGDIIDLTPAGCDRIELQGQPIVIRQNALHIAGPGWDRMTIDGNRRSSIFRHTGTRTLRISGVSIVRGQHRVADGDALGGCIYSAGRVRLEWSHVHHCTAYTSASGPSFGSALGGGIYALQGASVNHSWIFANEAIAEVIAEGGGIYGAGAGTTYLNYSRVMDNTASTSTSNISYGGGVLATNLQMYYSRLTGNYAGTAGSTGGIGGGAYVHGIGNILNSTISGNIAEQEAGGVGGYQITVWNSTFSGNRAPRATGVSGTFLEIYFSTIAYNDGFSSACAESAAAVQDYYIGILTIFSSILANNSCEGQPAYDLASEAGLGSNGANIITSSQLSLPQDTIRTDPMLKPLAYNGGIGLTHALKFGSPAIDAGYNDYSGSPRWDQRGPGFPRPAGAEPDIGAYEYRAGACN